MPGESKFSIFKIGERDSIISLLCHVRKRCVGVKARFFVLNSVFITALSLPLTYLCKRRHYNEE
jgi:hypothetical protein